LPTTTTSAPPAASFYSQDNAQFSHGTEGDRANGVNVTGQKNIDKKILELADSSAAGVEVTQIDCQYGNHDSVVIQVIGTSLGTAANVGCCHVLPLYVTEEKQH